MSLYPLALFVHVSGAIGTCVSLGIWLFGLSALRRARLVEQMRALAWLIIITSLLMVLSVLLLGVGGFEMALSTWGLSTPWIAVSLVSVILIGPIEAFVLDPRMRSLLAVVRETPEGPLPDAIERRTHDPILITSASTLATMPLGVVFLMTTKPQLVPSILVMGSACIFGLIVSLPVQSAKRKPARPDTAHRTLPEADPLLRKTIWTRRW